MDKDDLSYLIYQMYCSSGSVYGVGFAAYERFTGSWPHLFGPSKASFVGSMCWLVVICFPPEAVYHAFPLRLAPASGRG